MMSARALLPGRLGWVLALSCLTASAVRAQDWTAPVDSAAPPLVLRDLNLWAAAAADPAAPAPRTPRIRLPRMPLTSLGDPLGLIDDGTNPPTDADVEVIPLQVSMGEDNPFFDFRRRGTPGGVGYYKVHTQWQFFDTGKTDCLFSFQVVRPAGLESNGVSEGPSFVSPALTVFHDLGDGSALHGFVGTDIRANSTWRDGLGDKIRYGVAVQQPLSTLVTDPGKGLFLFLEAQGNLSDRDQGVSRSWELVPGLHYRMSESWWMSGGLLVPVGPTRYGSPGHWHLSCSWQY
jgi:hypothetical protein